MSKIKISRADHGLKKFYRRIAYVRQIGLCVWCDEYVAEIDATAEHIIEHSAGGDISRDNIVMACLRCNQARGTGFYERSWRRMEIKR